MDRPSAAFARAREIASRGRNAVIRTWQRIKGSVDRGYVTTTTFASEGYNSALDWKDNSELSRWLTDRLSHQVSTVGSRAMDSEYLRTHIGGGWHRLYDGGHSLAGSWKAVSEALPDLSVLEQLGTWANEYWKDLVTTRGMPIVILDHAEKVSEYFKHLDSVNLAQAIGGELTGVSIYCNWNDPARLTASAASNDCSGLVYANVVAPLVSLIALGRAYYLLRQSEQDDLRDLIAPALRGLTRSGASVLLITVIPGGFLLHLSSGIVISLAHNYVWDRASENKELIFAHSSSVSKHYAALSPKLDGRGGDDRWRLTKHATGSEIRAGG
jgi:hypothetical protein